jgi:uracil-DNA glycosylase
MTLSELLNDIRACTHCKEFLPCAPRPIVQADSSARLRIIGQAPGRRVQETGVPWNDPSGERLRKWLGISNQDFYDAGKVALVPMGFCYPGQGKSGDNPPRPECAPRWHARLNAFLPDIRLTLLIGQYAQAHYLGGLRKATLTETVRAWEEYRPLGFLPLPHPSPRNQAWFKRNPWFEKELIPELRDAVRAQGAEKP